MKKETLDGLLVIVGIITGMTSIWLFFLGGFKKIIEWFLRPGKRFKALEDSAQKFEEELADLKVKHENSQKEFKHDIETLESDYKEIFKLLLNRK